MPHESSLTADQRVVADQPIEARIIATAGPGTGKTHTLVARIEALLSSDEEIAGQDLLSLSFSRAAVGVLRRRVSALTSRAARVRSATFDSFATRILEAHGDVELERVGYDRRIELATELLADREIDDLRETRHLFVDEAQDLTGVRAEFVLKLMEVIDCGFTVFADEAQAVYDFAGESASGPTFLDRVRAEFGETSRAMHLATNRRTTDRELLAIAELGNLVRSPVADRSEIVERFGRAVQGLPAAGSIENAAVMLTDGNDVAILTRRNSDALAVSQALYDSGVRHQMRRRADDPVIGSWLCMLQRQADSSRITIDDVERAAPTLPWSPDVTWAALSRAARPRRGFLNLVQVAENLADRIPPDELVDNGSGGIVVSSIHRAKGLEFGTVLLVPFDIDVDDWLEEARVLYVGLTRARHNLMSLAKVDDRRWGFVAGTDRWRRVGFAGKNRYTTGVEVAGSDAATFDPAGASSPTGDVGAVCDYLLNEVAPGDPVQLQLRHGGSDDAVIYDAHHNGRWVASTTPRFGEVVSRRLGLKRPPATIEGCRIETVATTAISAPVAEMFGLSDQLVPNCRIQGVGTW